MDFQAGKYRGFTLVELLSYMGLGSLLILIMVAFFNSVVKQHVYISERITIRKIGALLIHSLKKDIESSTSAGIWSPPDSATTLIQPITSTVPPAEITWSDSTICYRHYPSEHQVKRWEPPISSINSVPHDPTSPHPFTENQISGAPEPAPEQQVKTWGNIDKFEVQKNYPEIEIKLSLSLVDTKGHQHNHSLSQKILLRNGEEL